ncbi:hypothetical protein [Pseudoalteromonas rubra]|uniref:hypothetical protein n=1 Tax=Pseudoalteromonas rubra TaxID=43658 RepID=UPI000F79CD13|nr:hypothetical protein [Pseudoalteromonas rubra]
MRNKAIILACGLATAPQVIAAPQPIEQLKIAGDVVHITLAQTTNPRTPAACVSPDNASKWTLSLNTASGKASYALLVNAFEKEKQVEIEGTGDCTDHPGVERAYAVSVQQKHGDESVLYVYKGDGVTKLGRILKWEPGSRWEHLQITYLSGELGHSVKTFNPRTYYDLTETYSIYFSEENCTGVAGYKTPGDEYTYYHSEYNNGQFFKFQHTSQITAKSRLDISTEKDSNSCWNIPWQDRPKVRGLTNTRTVSIEKCGTSPCIIKP